MAKEAKQHIDILQQSSDNDDSYVSLTQILLAKLILFNRRRQGEVSKTLLTDWEKRGKADCSSEAVQCQSEFEKSLLSVLERIEIRGKKGRTVPIIFTSDVAQRLAVLIQCRPEHIPPGNPFLFATKSESTHYRGSDTIRKFAAACDADKPQLLTSTKLRKQVATLAQVLSLQPHELDAVAAFLGHDIRVQSDFYRMPLDVMQLARISKVFLAADQGRIAEFSGKALCDINLDPNEEVETEVDEVELSAACNQNIADKDNSDSVEELENTDEDAPEQPKRKLKCKQRNKAIKKKWSEEEKECVKCYFTRNILCKKLPSKMEIEAFLSEDTLVVER